MLQVLTGEGKSIVLGILTALLACVGYSVDVVSYSSYLSKRDHDDFLQLFTDLNLNNIIKYGTIEKTCDEFLNFNGDLRNMSSNLIEGKD